MKLLLQSWIIQKAKSLREAFHRVLARVPDFASMWPRLLPYIAVSGVPALSSLILTPVMINGLGKEQFASWALAEPLILLGGALVTFGAQFGVLRSAATADGQTTIPLSCFLAPVVVCPLAIVLDRVLLNNVSADLILPIVFAQVAEAFALIVTNFYRGAGALYKMAAIEGGRQVILTFATIYLISTLGQSAETIFWVLTARALSTILVIAPCVKSIVDVKAVSFSSALPHWKYGMPIVIAQLINILSYSVDRYLAVWSGLSRSDLTSYVAHLRVASIVNLAIGGPLALWFAPLAMVGNGRQAASLVRRLELFAVIAFVFVITCGNILSSVFWNYIFPHNQLNVLMLNMLLVSVCFQCLATIWNIGGLQQGQTMYNIVPPISALVIVSITAPILIHLFGPNGLSMAREAEFAVYALSFALISSRIIPTNSRPLGVMAFLLLAGIVNSLIFGAHQ